MNVFGMIVVVVFIVMTSVVILTWISARSKKAGDHKAQAEAATRNEKRIAALEDRVRVLEKLATDKGSRLRDEIDAL